MIEPVCVRFVLAEGLGSFTGRGTTTAGAEVVGRALALTDGEVEGVADCVALAEADALGVGEGVTTGVFCAGVGVTVALEVADGLELGVADAVEELLALGDALAEALALGEADALADGLALALTVTVGVGVELGTTAAKITGELRYSVQDPYWFIAVTAKTMYLPTSPDAAA